jgi:hypothetical protein
MTEPIDLQPLPPPRSFVAKSSVRQVVRAEIQAFTDRVLAEAIGTAIGTMSREAEQRCAALEAQIAGLRSAMQEFSYKGAWSERQYRAGNFVSMGGQVYHANADTTSRPGTDSTWTLAVKSGRDGRDGKDATPPGPPTEQTTRSHR